MECLIASSPMGKRHPPEVSNDLCSPCVPRVLISIFSCGYNMDALCLGPFVQEATKEEVSPSNSVLGGHGCLFGFSENGSVEGALPGVGELPECARDWDFQSWFRLEGSESADEQVCLLIPSCLMGKAQNPMPVVLDGGFTGRAASGHLGMLLAKVEADG
jgi:hypothetical protein